MPELTLDWMTATAVAAASRRPRRRPDRRVKRGSGTREGFGGQRFRRVRQQRGPSTRGFKPCYLWNDVGALNHQNSMTWAIFSEDISSSHVLRKVSRAPRKVSRAPACNYMRTHAQASTNVGGVQASPRLHNRESESSTLRFRIALCSCPRGISW
jgi:hypothetical protein